MRLKIKNNINSIMTSGIGTGFKLLSAYFAAIMTVVAPLHAATTLWDQAETANTEIIKAIQTAVKALFIPVILIELLLRLFILKDEKAIAACNKAIIGTVVVYVAVMNYSLIKDSITTISGWFGSSGSSTSSSSSGT